MNAALRTTELAVGYRARGARRAVLERLTQAFEGRQLRFHAAGRSFGWLNHDGGSAVVSGVGLRAALAVAVLERQGYTVSESTARVGTLSIEAHETGWRASVDDGEHHGADFASLATFLRHRRSST
jgi:hypothetical protein